MRIGPYEAISELGRGGMGVVWRCRAPNGREVAVKTLCAPGNAARVARFEREKKLLSSFAEEDGFVPLLDDGDTEEGPYLVMPLVTGGTLRERLASGRRLPVDEVVGLGIALASALERAHERGVVHRDLKPENVLFDGDGKPLVADLGLAKRLEEFLSSSDDKPKTLTLAGTGFGTAGFMPPEQILDVSSATPRVDVFALGSILFECLAGRPAFQGGSYMEVMANVASGERSPLRERRPDLPRWLVRVVERALAHDPRERYPDAGELRRALEDGDDEREDRRRGWLVAAGLVLSSLTLVVVAALALAPYLRKAPGSRSTTGAIDTLTKESASPRAESARDALADAERRSAAGDVEGAISRASRALELDPKLGAAWEARARLKLRKGDREGALADAGRAIAASPSAAAFALRGNVRRERGDLEGAVADLGRAIELAPRDAMLFYDRAQARAKSHDHASVLRDLDRAVELDPRFVLALRMRGLARRHGGDAAGGVADFERVVACEPRSARDWDELGTMRWHARDVAGALEAKTRATELDPKDDVVWSHRGSLHHERGDWEAAIRDLTKAIELAPASARYWSCRGGARSNKGDLDAALLDLDRALALDPELVHALVNRGITHGRRGEVAAAVADLSRAVALDPSDVGALENLGFAWVQSGDLERARSAYDRALAIDPGRVTTHGWRGNIRFRQGDFAGVIEDMSCVLQSNPKDAAALGMRGEARARVGDKAGARADLERCLEVAPGQPQAARARRVLEELR